MPWELGGLTRTHRFSLPDSIFSDTVFDHYESEQPGEERQRLVVITDYAMQRIRVSAPLLILSVGAEVYSEAKG